MPRSKKPTRLASKFQLSSKLIFAVLVCTFSLSGVIYGVVTKFSQASGACTTTVASSQNLSSIASNAAAGSVICLSSSADYGKLDLSEVSKTSDITIIPATGATPSLGLWLVDTRHFKLQGLTIAGGYIKSAHNITLSQNKFTDQLRVDGDPAGGMSLLIDSNIFDGINNNGGYDGRLSILGGGTDSTPVGVVVSNNHFGGGGDTDGVFLSGGINGAQIGPGNEFEDLHNVGGSHTDAIQLYGTSHTLLTGNYMHNNSSGIMAPDGSSDETITNNLVLTDGYACPIALGGAVNNSVTHNTLPENSICIGLANNCGARSSGNTVRDNIAEISIIMGWDSNGVPCSGSPAGFIAAQDHNISSSDSYYVGPLNPTDGSRPLLSAYVLKAGTPGKGAASDGTDIGINLTSTGGGGGTGSTPGDVNGDKKVGILDLSVTLSNFGKTSANWTEPRCDSNGDDKVTIIDLSVVLSKYGTVYP